MTLFYSFSDCAEQLQWADCTFVSQRQKDVWSCCERRSGNKTLCNIFRPNWRIVLVSFVFKLPKANASANTNTNLANIQIQATIGSLSLYGIVQLAHKSWLTTKPCCHTETLDHGWEVGLQTTCFPKTFANDAAKKSSLQEMEERGTHLDIRLRLCCHEFCFLQVLDQTEKFRSPLESARADTKVSSLKRGA